MCVCERERERDDMKDERVRGKFSRHLSNSFRDWSEDLPLVLTRYLRVTWKQDIRRGTCNNVMQYILYSSSMGVMM